MCPARSRRVLLAMCVASGATFIPACKKKDGGQEVAAARQALAEVEAEVAKVQKATADVRARFNALPEDLPGLEPVRSKLHAVEEVMGVENARVRWLAGELEGAAASGNEEQLKKVSETIRSSVEGSRRLGKPALELGHELLPFERMVGGYRAIAAAVTFTRVLPTGREIRGRKGGLENQLLDFIEDDEKKPDKKTWFAFDQLTFSGSGNGAGLDLERSNAQLENVAAILKAYPRVKLAVGGFTGDMGGAAANKKLSAEWAKAVRELLVSAGVEASRLTAEGYGAARPVCPADDTDECKAQNRRIEARPTAK